MLQKSILSLFLLNNNSFPDISNGYEHGEVLGLAPSTMRHSSYKSTRVSNILREVIFVGPIGQRPIFNFFLLLLLLLLLLPLLLLLLLLLLQSLRYALKKKPILFGNFFQTSDPPLLGTPYPKKIFVFILHFRT